MISIPRPRLPAGMIALRERNFVLYVIGQFISQFGSWIELTAVSWIFYELTNSPLLLGLCGLFRAAPMMSLALIGGAVADRFPKRKMLLFTETSMLVASTIIGLLAATHRLEYWHFYILNFVSGTLQAFSVPSRQALFGGLVPRPALQSAVTLNSLAVRGAGFAGPTVAGLALVYGGYALPFLLNAASFVAMLWALIAMHLVPTQTTARPALRQSMSEGVSFVWKTPILKVALSLEIASGLFGHNTTLVTVLAKDWLRAGPEGLGLLLSALGAGGLIGMALMVTFHIGRHGKLILIMGVAYTALWAAFAVSPWLWLSALLMLALGTSDGVWSVTRNTVAQIVVPDAMRGRVMSVVVLAVRGSSQLGRVMSGALVDALGGPGAILAGAAVIALALTASWRVRLSDFSGQHAQ